jgi:hypothetical protein
MTTGTRGLCTLVVQCAVLRPLFSGK